MNTTTLPLFLAARSIFGIAALSGALLFAPATEAASIIVNGDFETNSGNNTAFASWTIVGGGGSSIWRAETDRGSIGDGEGGGSTFFASSTQNNANAYFYQTFATDAGAVYQLSFYAARPNTSNNNFSIDVNVFDGSADPGTGSGGLLDQNVANAEVGVDPEWVFFGGVSYQFTAASTQTTLRFLDPGTTATDPAIDTVSIVLIPEPTTGALLGLSALTLLRRRRRA